MTTTRVRDFLKMDGLKMVHTNTRSMYKKRQDIFDQLNGIDIVSMSETWLHEEYDDDLIVWDGMKMYRQDRPGKKGGGIAVYVRDDLKMDINMRRDLSFCTKDLECFILDFTMSNSKIMRLVTLYRPPSGKLPKFFEDLEKMMKTKPADVTEQWFMGDININCLRENMPSSIKLVDICRFEGYLKLIHQCTRPFGKTVACLDQILTNTVKDVHSGVLNFLVSDHLPVFCIKTKVKIEYLTKSVRVRKYKDFNPELFKDWLSDIDWDVYYECKDPDDAWLMIENSINEFLDVYCPWVTIEVVDKRNKWMTIDILSMIKQREDNVDLYLATKDPVYLALAKQLRCRITRAIEYSKASLIRESLEETKTNPKKFWRLINSVLKPEVNVEPPTLIGDDGFIKTSQASVDYLNSYFSKIGSVLSDELTKKGHPERKQFTEPIDPVYPKIKVDKGLVDILFSEINVNKTSGMEGIRCDVLKVALRFLLVPMTWLYQLAFDTGIFPNCWKIARVSPIPKNSNLKFITNWRPISLLAVPSKIAERIMHIHLTQVIEDADFLSDKQFGYRLGLGTGDAIFGVLNDIYENRARGHLTCACFIDLKKAFDSVHHLYLFEVLGKLGLDDSVLNWLMSYLTGRSQFTKIGSTKSPLESVDFGVPQGSVLGPLLFIVYINDVVDRMGECKYCLYADDLVLYSSANKLDLIQSRLQTAMDNIGAWCIDKRLTVNVEKTKIVWYGSTQKLPKSVDISFTLNGAPVEVVNDYTYLGLKIDGSLSFEPALKDLNKKVNHKLFRFGHFRHLLTENVSVFVYKSTILSQFDYASFAHDGANSGSLKKLDRLQLRGLKTCYRGKDLTESELYDLSCVPRLPRRRKELLLSYMYKLSHRDSWLDKSAVRPGLRSENKIRFKVPRTRCSGYTKSPLFRGAQAWDLLGDWYQLSKDKLTFKQRLSKIENLDTISPNPKDLLVAEHDSQTI